MSDCKIEPTLFIGGPADGKQMYVKSSRVLIPERCTIPSISDQLIPVDRFSPYTETMYTIQKITGEKECFNIMVADGMSVDEMLAALIDGYKNTDTKGDL